MKVFKEQWSTGRFFISNPAGPGDGPVSVRVSIFVAALMAMAGHVLAYPAKHGPFPEEAKVERIEVTDLVVVSQNPDLELSGCWAALPGVEGVAGGRDWNFENNS